MGQTLRNRVLWIFLLLISFIYLINSSYLAKTKLRQPILLAHRGLGQTFSTQGLTNETCTAKRIYPPEHPYLENTLSSMEAAYKYGADIVELDIHPTTDGEFAVFHDWTLDCRTNGTGIVREYTLAELKKLDIGYGYTADKGKTYPFRGKGIGLMPSLKEVLKRFPTQSLLIHIKSNDPKEGQLLADYLGSLKKKRLNQLAVYGGDEPISVLKTQLPQLRVMSKATLIKSMLWYFLIGWTGYVPSTCRNTELHIPERYTSIAFSK